MSHYQYPVEAGLKRDDINRETFLAQCMESIGSLQAGGWYIIVPTKQTVASPFGFCAVYVADDKDSYIGQFALSRFRVVYPSEETVSKWMDIHWTPLIKQVVDTMDGVIYNT